MTVNHYNWKNGPAEIQQHSVAKLDVLRAYLIQYFKTLASLPQQDVFKLTLVDCTYTRTNKNLSTALRWFA